MELSNRLTGLLVSAWNWIDYMNGFWNVFEPFSNLISNQIQNDSQNEPLNFEVCFVTGSDNRLNSKLCLQLISIWHLAMSERKHSGSVPDELETGQPVPEIMLARNEVIKPKRANSSYLSPSL